MSSSVLQDVVAYLVNCDSVQNAKAAIQDRLKKSGAKVVTRLTKEVSHVILERKRSQKASDKADNEKKIAELYRKLEALPYPPFVVNPLWVEESIAQKRRLIETKFMVARPKENILAGPSGGASGAADGSKKKRRRRSPGPPAPPADTYDLDPSDWVFSSTQQLNEDESEAEHRAAARGGPGARRRGERHVKARQAHAPQPIVEETEGEGFCPGIETQAVADIMAMDLPFDEEEEEEEQGAGPEAQNERAVDEIEGMSDDDLDTPLGVRFARQSGGKTSLGGSVPRAPSGSGNEGGSKPKQAARSRLAQASGPRVEQEDPIKDVDVVPCTQEEEAKKATKPSADAPRAPITGVAQRFSVRQLQRHPERPVQLHKGTPLPGVMPKSATRKKKHGGPIPIPFVARVESPWNTKTQPSQEDLSQPDTHVQAHKVNATTLRASLGARGGGGGGSLGPRKRPSSIGVHGEGSKGATGTGTGTPWTHFKHINTHQALPSPWSAPRAWDGGAVGAPKHSMGASQLTPDDTAGMDVHDHEEARVEEETEEGGGGEELSELGEVQEDGDVEKDFEMVGESEGEEEENNGKENAPSNAGNGVHRRQKQQKAAHPCAPQHGWIALTSVSVAITDLAKSAAQRLRGGLRVCTIDRQEERQMTHLVIGEERRTLKALLAVANGAEMVSPEWVTASLEAGKWLPTGDFPAAVRFSAAAERARRSMAGPEGHKLLDGQSIHLYVSKRGDVAAGAALRRLATALGARVVPAATCTMCIAVGETPKRPAGLSREIPTVSEEWLLQAAEQYKLPAARQFVVR